MTKVSAESEAVNARIVYWGIEGAGKTTNLRMAHSKLRPDHRGEVREVASQLGRLELETKEEGETP